MAVRQGINSAHLKSRNRGLVLQQIASGSISRAAIARQIGLTKMTVTNLVGELIEAGVVQEKAAAGGTAVGRSPVPLAVAPHAPKVAGLYIARETAGMILTDLQLRVLASRTVPLAEETADTLRGKLFRLTDEALRAAGGDPVAGIGVSAIGPLDPHNGVLLRPTAFFGITDFPVAALLAERYALPVRVLNDMNAAALAEKLFGAGRELDNFLYVGISNGIGAGIISGGRLYRDTSGYAGEIGHMCINFDGPVCTCGSRGCLETYANMPVLLARLRQAVGKPVSTADFAALEGDPACAAVFRDTADKLAAALVNAANLFDPQCIFLGHEAVFLPQSCLARIAVLLERRTLAAGYQKIPLRLSAFREKAPLLGSAAAILSEIFSGQLSC